MVFLGVEIELYPLSCVFSLLHSLLFQAQMYYAITNFSVINQKNNVTAIFRNSILQLGESGAHWNTETCGTVDFDSASRSSMKVASWLCS